MSKRPINLPPHPLAYALSEDQLRPHEEWARAAVEADRAGIEVTREDEIAAMEAVSAAGESYYKDGIFPALESFAKRLRGEA